MIIRRDCNAVYRNDPCTSHSRLTAVLVTVSVPVIENLADDITTVKNGIGNDIDFVAGDD